MRIEFISTEERAYRASGNRTLTVFPGPIRGDFIIAKFTDPFLCTEDRNCLTVRFDFKDRIGVCYRHSSVVSAGTLWPPEGSATTWEPPLAFESHVAVAKMLDGRNPYSIIVNGKDRLSGRLKYVEAQFALMITLRTVLVRNRFFCGDQAAASGHGEPGYCTIYYELPFAHFLWRQAVEFCEDDFLPEGRDYITLLEVGEMGLPESAIEVERRK